jgi:nucleoid-associated protein YgaU
VTPLPPIPPAPLSADDAPSPAQPIPDARPMPPVGAPSAATTPAIQIGTPTVQPRPPAAAPQVDSFDEEMYRCRGGDTFEGISQRFFGAPEYSQALLLFNRAHPMAAQGLQQMPPALNAGTIVYIPPVKILEKRYPTVIPNLTIRNEKPGQPTALPAPSAVQSVWKKYRVGRAGERMMDIAARALGNWERWKEIYKLNNQYQPHAMVPANVVLNLPPDAKIDADHAP